MKIKKVIEKYSGRIEDFFYEKIKLICLAISISFCILYFKGYLANIRDIMSDIITLATIIFAIISMVLSLLSKLDGSQLWKRKSEVSPNFDEEIYALLKSSLMNTVIVLIIALFISIIRTFKSKILKFFICILGTYSFAYMMIGTLYLLFTALDLTLRSKDYEKNIKNNRPWK